MNKNFLIAIIGIAVLIGGGILVKNRLYSSNSKKVVTNLNQVEKQVAKDLGLKEGKPNVSSYPKAKVDVDKCGEDAFYVEEKSADFVKNYCRFLKENGWKLVHQDYPDCNDIKSFGGGYNYEKGGEKIAVSVIRYGENAACFWVFKR